MNNELELNLTIAEDTDDLPEYIVPSGATSYDVIIKITYNPASGELTAEANRPNSEFAFVNNYKAEGEITFEGTKTVEGRDWDAEKDIYEFAVYEVVADTSEGAAEGATKEELVATLNNAAEGKIEYPTIEYEYNVSEGKDDSVVHTYKVYETSTDKDGVRVDRRDPYTVTVTVTDNNDGTLNADANGSADGLDFVNTFGADTTISLSAKKTLNGHAFDDETFKFKFTLSGDVIEPQTKYTDSEGNVTFDTLKFS